MYAHVKRATWNKWRSNQTGNEEFQNVGIEITSYENVEEYENK